MYFTTNKIYIVIIVSERFSNFLRIKVKNITSLTNNEIILAKCRVYENSMRFHFVCFLKQYR